MPMHRPNPYSSQPDRTFWRKAVSAVHYAGIEELWQAPPLTRQDRIATAGSCFAQHIGRHMARRGAAYMDLEPAPAVLSNAAEGRRWGYGVYSCRYGNVYTCRQLLQLMDEAHEMRVPVDRVWEKEGRFYDALRPSIDPVGQDSPQTVLALRQRHLLRVREMFATLNVLIFTMGLTEGWESSEDGTMYPTAPGTVAGAYQPARHALRNLRHAEVLADMQGVWERLRAINPQARMILTVSPVPLAATATSEHVLVASTHSKAVLRAVAGELARDHAEITYFPSYEVIATHPSRGTFFNADLRTVSEFGVDHVMSHFFSGSLAAEFGTAPPMAEEETPELICDEDRLDTLPITGVAG